MISTERDSAFPGTACKFHDRIHCHRTKNCRFFQQEKRTLLEYTMSANIEIASCLAMKSYNSPSAILEPKL